MDSVGCIIVAAGRSQRMNGKDKIFASLAGKPLIAHTINVFQKNNAVQQIVLALKEDNLSSGQKLLDDYRWSKLIKIYPGGEHRQDSVARGFSYLPDCQWIIIHDGSRPCLTGYIIDRGLCCVQETGAAIAAVPITDTIKVVNGDFIINDTPDRTSLWAAQTPQIFRRDIIIAAHDNAIKNNLKTTDDAALVEKLGYKVKIYRGSYDNIKVTTSHDLSLAEIILTNKRR